MFDSNNEWIQSIINKAKNVTNSDECRLVLFDHRNDKFHTPYTDADDLLGELKGKIREVIYTKEPDQKEHKGYTYYLFPITTEVGPIGALVFKNEDTTEGFAIVGGSERHAKEAASIIGHILTDNLFNRIGSMGVNPQGYHPRDIESTLPVGEHDCVVMFVDFRSLTLLLNKCDDNDAVYKIVRDFIEIIGAATRTHYGVVNKYMGAGALLLFGVTVDDEVINGNKNISILRAICAAAKIQQRFQKKEEEWYRNLRDIFPKKRFEGVFQDVDIGIGINAQTPRLLTVGDDIRHNYSCFGSDVTLAKCIESICGRKEHRGEGWEDQAEYCSIMFSSTVEFRLNNLQSSSQMIGEIEIELISGPENVQFSRFRETRDLNTFSKIKIDNPDIQPELTQKNTIIEHVPVDNRWKISFLEQ